MKSISNNYLDCKDSENQQNSNIDIEKLSNIPTENYKHTHPNSFPFWTFPKPIRDIIIETNKVFNFPIDFISASLFWASGMAIGGTRIVSLNGSKTSKANLWIVTVAHRGIGKSAPLDWAVKPFEKIENRYYSDYRFAYSEWKNQKGENKGDPPVRKKVIVDDFTLETLATTHTKNPRGVGVVNDELIGWLKTLMDNNSKNKSKWMTIWSGGRLDVIRTTREDDYLSSTFIPVIGTTQPSKLKEFLTNDNIGDGLADRILFINAENEENKPFSRLNLSEDIVQSWHSIIQKMMNIELEFDVYKNPKPKILSFSDEAKEYLLKWQEKTVIYRNKMLKENPDKNDYLRAYAKHDDYVQRFALIIQIMDDVCFNRVSNEISLESIKGAVEISEYFMNNFKEVFYKVKGFGIKNIKGEAKEFFNDLPTEFAFSEAVNIGEKQGIHKSTVKRYLKNQSLYGQAKRGRYHKIINSIS